MTPQRLHSALGEARTARGLMWWQVAVQADIGESALYRLSRGVGGLVVRERAEERLRRQAPRQKKE